MKKYDIIVIEKPVEDGLSAEAVSNMLRALASAEIFALEIDDRNKSSSAMGFITKPAADALDYDYEKSGLRDLLQSMMDSVTWESKAFAINNLHGFFATDEESLRNLLEKKEPKSVMYSINILPEIMNDYAGTMLQIEIFGNQLLKRHINSNEVINAIKGACRDYCNNMADNDAVFFNAGDFICSVGNEYCEKYGFRIISTIDADTSIPENESLI